MKWMRVGIFWFLSQVISKTLTRQTEIKTFQIAQNILEILPLENSLLFIVNYYGTVFWSTLE